MKKIKSVLDKMMKKNRELKKQVEKKSDNLKFKVGDPTRLNIYW